MNQEVNPLPTTPNSPEPLIYLKKDLRPLNYSRWSVNNLLNISSRLTATFTFIAVLHTPITLNYCPGSIKSVAEAPNQKDEDEIADTIPDPYSPSFPHSNNHALSLNPPTPNIINVEVIRAKTPTTTPKNPDNTNSNCDEESTED